MLRNSLLRGNTPILLDGGMGTMLQAKGLPAGAYPELAALEHPGWLEEIHSAYRRAGSQILCANTFGANREKLKHTGFTAEQVISASIAIARRAAGEGGLVALDIGPIGQLLEPTGTLPFDHAADIFAQMVLAGVATGADLIVIETMTDLQEMRAAVLAAKEHSDLPILAAMTYEAGGRTFLGCDVSSCVLTLEGLGVDAVGINCSLGPGQMGEMVEQMLCWTTLPLLLKPNAGLPDPASGGYDVTAEEFARIMAGYADRGVLLLGGCCGTTPEYIAQLAHALKGKTICREANSIPAAVCSGSRTVPIDRVRVIGERINPTGKKLMKDALLRGDVDYMLSQALEQTRAGAEILDVNVGLPGIDEAEMMQRVVKALQSVTDAPLQIDSTSPPVIEKALRCYCGKAIVNSVNGDEDVMESILPLVKKYGAAVVGLTLDHEGIPKTTEKRMEIARRILEKALSYGIRREDVYIDCLTLTVSAEQEGAAQTLDALGRLRRELGVKTVLGVSNISFGLPARPLINQNFLTMAMTCGLDLPILNPNVDTMMDAVRSYHLLMNVDKEAREFISHFARTQPSPGTGNGASCVAPAEVTQARSLEEIVTAGLRKEAEGAAQALLTRREPMEIVNEVLIPALDRVGARFEAGEIFLPQLIQSAAAAQAAFGAIRRRLLREDGASQSRGVVVVATVQGDIHDIGKNILKVLLENYNYTVIDLGKDVPPQAVLEAVRRHNAPLVGLSALMTTTLKSMEETIALLRREGTDCRVMVGGAVLTADYAKKIGADFYAKDAKEGVDIAQSVLP